MGKRTIKEITLKKGDKITIRNINGRNISGEVSNIKDECAEAMTFEAISDSNFRVHHIEIIPGNTLPTSNALSEVLTFSEVGELWGIDPSALRHRVTSEKLVEGVDFRKSGKVWLIARNAMERLYGLK